MRIPSLLLLILIFISGGEKFCVTSKVINIFNFQALLCRRHKIKTDEIEIHVSVITQSRFVRKKSIRKILRA